MLQLLSKPFFSSLCRRRKVIPVSGGSRGGARWSPSFLDQTKARRAEKKFWRPGPPLSQRLDPVGEKIKDFGAVSRNFFLAFAKPFFCYQLFDNLGATKVNLDLKSE